MSDDKGYIATSIEINTMDQTEPEEYKDTLNDNPATRDVADSSFAMNLKRSFDDGMEVYEPVNWKLITYWLHLWSIYALFNYTGDQFDNNRPQSFVAIIWSRTPLKLSNLMPENIFIRVLAKALSKFSNCSSIAFIKSLILSH